ncbi:hypothetical protein TNCV_1667231 [Trichonephila clavipes]|nr:hypothetical protein TNCV_1667231 [Trichonephila clavipes]
MLTLRSDKQVGKGGLRPQVQKQNGVSVTNTRAFDDGPRHFEPWSSDVDDTGAGTPSPNYHTTPTGGRLSSRQI